jgi:hypothetical protein
MSGVKVLANASGLFHSPLKSGNIAAGGQDAAKA